MSATPQSHQSVQRLNKAYVQIPLSPLSAHFTTRSPAHVAASSKLKENTPLRPSLFAMASHASSSTLKRKLSDRDISTHVMDAVVISTKKSRLSMDATALLKSRQLQPTLPLTNATPQYPSGWVYCHQCNKKRDVTETIHCSVIEIHHYIRDKTPREHRCANKYCKSCLLNRYEEDIRQYKPQLSGRNGAVYGFECPRCRGACNCPRCRKSQGLEAVGYIPKQKPLDPSLKETKIKKPLVPKVAKKLLPQLKWRALATNLSQEEVDARACIREFSLRFGDFLDPVPSKSQMEELDYIAGRRRQGDDNVIIPWASEMCIRTLIVSILGLLANDYEDEILKLIKSSVKNIKACGANLSKIWNVMAALRSEIAKVCSPRTNLRKGSGNALPLTFPDPSPPSAEPPHTLRNRANSVDNMTTIVHTTQMIPVLLSLIQSALETAVIREEIDQGTKDAKDFGHDARIATKVENERWDKERSVLEAAAKDTAQKVEIRDKRTAHKLQITNVENALKIIGPSFLPRVTTLGTDTEGRIYYAMSPGLAERESAVEYLELAASDKLRKPKKKARILSPEDRSEMREWSWFVAVWGQNPAPPSQISGHVDNPEYTADAKDTWWGFWEPDEIVKLAQWISIKAGIDDDDTGSNAEAGSSTSHREKAALTPRMGQFRRLSTGLQEYATLLRWRIRDDKTTLLKTFTSDAQLHSLENAARERVKPSPTATSPAT